MTNSKLVGLVGERSGVYAWELVKELEANS